MEYIERLLAEDKRLQFFHVLTRENGQGGGGNGRAKAAPRQTAADPADLVSNPAE